MLTYFKYPKNSSWKILYSKFEGLQRKAVELLSKEVGKYLIREEGKYKIYVLPCEKEETANYQNAIVVSLYNDSEIIKKYVKKEELNGKDYVVKFVPSIDDDGAYLGIITANDEQSLYYATVDFCYDYPYENGACHGGLVIPKWAYDYKMWISDYSISNKSEIKTRGIWSWGQVINDYRNYIETLAKLKLNQMIIWNEFVPLNAKEIVDYAHSFGIKVIWGFAWGWKTNCNVIESLDDEYLKELKAKVLQEYEENYSKLNQDGIYFQSFTEMQKDTVGGRVIADVVTEFVNETAGELLKRYPNLKIQFGLHATSVKDHLDSIKKVDKRIEIIWEDCGTFPYDYIPKVKSEEEFENTLKFTKEIINLRGNAPTSLIFKGLTTVDWEMFVHQSGPYILGENSKEIIESDRRLKEDIVKEFDSGWLEYGEYALKVVKEVLNQPNTNVGIYMCSEDGFNSGVNLGEKIFSEIVFSPNRTYGEILKKSYRK